MSYHTTAKKMVKWALHDLHNAEALALAEPGYWTHQQLKQARARLEIALQRQRKEGKHE